jgi:universal stress protein E
MERRRIESDVLKLAAAHGLPAERVHLVQGSATEVLPRAVVDLRADLVLMGAVSRSRFEELFIGSTAERVLDRLPVDVLVVKPPDFVEQMPL